ENEALAHASRVETEISNAFQTTGKDERVNTMTTSNQTGRRRKILARAVQVALPAGLCLATLTLLGAEGTTQPATTQPTNHNSTTTHGITTAPSGGLMLNFKDAPIDNVLDELSS